MSKHVDIRRRSKKYVDGLLLYAETHTVSQVAKKYGLSWGNTRAFLLSHGGQVNRKWLRKNRPMYEKFEDQILALLKKGKTQAETAKIVGISVMTVGACAANNKFRRYGPTEKKMRGYKEIAAHHKKHGGSYASTAEFFGTSRQRVHQIVKLVAGAK